MTEQYNHAVARHYAAYRPPLHQLILKKVFRPEEYFLSGLDIGCGTGYSAIALTAHCREVVGLDPSDSMLEKAQRHAHVTYVNGRGEDLQQFQRGAFDVITFAGSLFYTKSDSLRRELMRVSSPNCSIVVYDFEVHLEGPMDVVGLSMPPVSSDYDHAAGLDDLKEFSRESKVEENVRLDVTAEEASHILLSDSNRYEAISNRFPNINPFDATVDLLDNHPKACELDSTIYYARYRVEG